MNASNQTDRPDPLMLDATGLFHAIFEQGTIGVAQIETATGRFLLVNQRYSDMVGYSLEEMKRLDFQAITHPDDLAAGLEKMQRLVAGEIREFTLEKRYCHKEGRVVWVNLTVAPLWRPGEPPKHHLVMAEDITERKRDQEALRRSEEMFRRTFDFSPAGAVLVGLDCRFTRCNEAFCRFLGYTETELLGRSFLEVTFPEDKEIGQPEIHALIAGSLDRAQVRKRYVRKDGSIVWGEESISLVRDARGQPLFFLTIVQGVTEYQRAEAALRQQASELVALNAMGRAVNATLDLERTMTAALQGILNAVHPDLTYLFLREGDRLVLREMLPLSARQRLGLIPEHRVGECLCGLAAREKKPLYSRDIFKDQRCTWEECKLAGLKSFAALPLHSGDEIIGVIGLASVTERDFEGQAAFLETLAGQVMIALVNARLFDSAQRELADRQRAEKELRALSSHQQALLVAIPDIIMEVDVRKVYTWANQAGFGFFGDDVIGKEASYYFEGEQRVYDLVKPLFDGRECVTYLESWQRRRDGQHRLLAWWCTVLKDEQGKVTGAISSARDITERQQAEQALRDSEALYQSLVENLRQCVFRKDPDGRFTFANRQFCDLVGRPLPDLIGLTDFDLFPRELAEKYRLDDRQVMASGQSFEIVEDHRTPVGEERFVQVVKTPLRDATGQIVGVQGIFWDITERKRSEAMARNNLARAQRQRAAMVRMTTDETIAAGDVGRGFQILTEAASEAIEVARASLWLLTENREELVCADLFELGTRTHTEGLRLRSQNYPRYLAAIQTESRLCAADARTDPRTREFTEGYLVPLGITSMLDAAIQVDGRLAGVVCLEHIGERREWQADEEAFSGAVSSIAAEMLVSAARKRAEAELLNSEKRFRAMVEWGGDAITLIGAEGQILYEGPTVARLTGFTSEERLGKNAMTNVHPEDLPTVRSILARVLDQPGNMESAIFRSRRKDGSVWWTEGTATNLLHEPSVRAIVVNFRDVSERHRAEAEKEKLRGQLTQAQKMESVGRLAGGVAHDFNNMLQAILGNAAMALLDLPLDSPVRESLEEIQKSAERSADLTRQLLAFARKQTIQPKVLDLNDTVAGMLKMLRRLIGENINLAWVPGADLWSVKVDPSQIDQILANLCVNARDAIASGGKITIETCNVTLDSTYAGTHPECVPGNYVMLAVSDTGPGIDTATRAHLFEPFFTTKELGKGTGLGLATVFGIVQQNGGLINVYSEPGQGTSFKIYLPRAAAESMVAEPRTDHRSLRGTETILLVEDEEQILNLGRRILEQQGYRVLVASTPEAALALVARHTGPIQLLITDVVMPGMNGRALLDSLRASHPGLRCLFMSGYTADVIAHHGVLEDGVKFLQKPFSIQNLAEKAREVLEQAQQP